MNNRLVSNSTIEQKHGLDILKFLMAILVVSIHARLFEETDWLFQYVNPLKMVSVPCFFVISSYLFFKRVENNQETEIASLIHYLKRMLLFYLFWFIVMLPMTIVVRKWYLHFDVIKFLRSFFLSSTFRGSYFIMALIIGVPIIFYLRKVIHPIAIMFITFTIHLLFQHPIITPIIGGGKFLHFSFLPNLIWISIGFILTSFKNINQYKSLALFVFMGILYLFMLHPIIEPFLRPAFVVTLFILFYNLPIKENHLFLVLRKISILVFVTHFFFNSGYFYLAEGKYPIMNNSILHFVTILSLSLLTSLVFLKLMNNTKFRWLKNGL